MDQVHECSLSVPSGRLVIAGCTDYLPTAARIPVQPGWYRARIYYGGLDTLTADELDGDDHYQIVLWPSGPSAPQTLKRYVKARPD
jgi:hypothetical protein